MTSTPLQRLSNLHIQRFRGLRDVELTDLGQVNLVVGPNNAGKTSVLEALSIFANPLDQQAWNATARRRDGGISDVEALGWLFPRSKGEPAEEIFLEGGSPRLSIRASLHELPGTLRLEQRIAGLKRRLDELDKTVSAAEQNLPTVRSQWQVLEVQSGRHLLQRLQNDYQQIRDGRKAPPRPGARIQGSVTREQEQHALSFIVSGDTFSTALLPGIPIEEVLYWGDPDFTLAYPSVPYTRVDVPAGWSFPVFAVTPSDRRAAADQLRQFSDATVASHRDDVVAALRLLDPQIQDLEILVRDGGPGLYVRHARLGHAPVSAFGDGLRRALLYALSLPGLRGGLLLIDELEAALHVSALSQLFGWLVEACTRYQVQLFATTHSLEALDAVLTAAGDRAEVVGYHIDSNATPPVTRYSGAMLQRLRYERGLDVR